MDDYSERVVQLRDYLEKHPLYKLSYVLRNRLAESHATLDLKHECQSLANIINNINSPEHQLLFDTYCATTLDQYLMKRGMLKVLANTPVAERATIMDAGIEQHINDLKEFSRSLAEDDKFDEFLEDYLKEVRVAANFLSEPEQKLAFLQQLIVDVPRILSEEVKAVHRLINFYNREGKTDKASRIKEALFATPLRERQHLLTPPSRVLNALAADKEGFIRVNRAKHGFEFEANVDFAGDYKKITGSRLPKLHFPLYLAPEINTILARNPWMVDKMLLDGGMTFEQSLDLPPKTLAPGTLQKIANLWKRFTGRTLSPPIAPIAGGGSAGPGVTPPSSPDTTASLLRVLSSVTPSVSPPADSPSRSPVTTDTPVVSQQEAPIEEVRAVSATTPRGPR